MFVSSKILEKEKNGKKKMVFSCLVIIGKILNKIRCN